MEDRPLDDEVRFVAAPGTGSDARGSSFSIPPGQLEFLGGACDMHVASIRPGHVRGNHFHAERRELIVVVHEDRWSLHWDRGPDTEVRSQAFSGAGAVAITVPPRAAHAIRNDGEELLWLVATTDAVFDPANPDSHPRRVVG